jgi:hypothetical protein
LDGILRFRIVLEDGSRGAEKAAIVAPHQGLERLVVPGRRAGNEVGIRRRSREASGSRLKHRCSLDAGCRLFVPAAAGHIIASTIEP